MKSKALLLCVISFYTFNLLIAQNNTIVELTKEKYKEDFEFLYQELKLSYPYFGVNKRLFKEDWLGNKSKYLHLIESSNSDTAFYKNINTILNNLNNGHTDTYPTIIYDYFYNGYKNASEHSPILKCYVDELEKTTAKRCAYWKSISENSKEEKQEEDIIEKEDVEIANVQIRFNEKQSIAMIKINSFSYELIEEDAFLLKKFFIKAQRFDNLIIDIQGNTGGDDTYWRKHIIPHLTNKEITYPIVLAFKTSKRISAFKPNYQSNIEQEELEFKNLPEELKTGEFKFLKSENSIKPNSESKRYKGNIYLLVDRLVYSSAETLAYFCKSTKIATVVGEITGGNGIGTDPLLLTLPNSGIVIRFTGEMALNPDGSSNEEMKTVPDYQIKNLNKIEEIEKVYQKIIMTVEGSKIEK